MSRSNESSKESKFNKIGFSQQSSNAHREVSSHEVDNREKVPKIPKMLNLASTGISRSTSIDNKPKQKCVSFAKLSLSVV